MRRLKKKDSLFILYCVSIMALAIWGFNCGGGGSSGGSTNGGGNTVTLDGPRDLPGSSTEVISAQQGGKLETANGISMEIPPGALFQDIKITMTPVKVDDIGDLFINGVRFEPEGTSLKTPGLVRFPLPATWDGGVSPEIYVFSGKDPQDAVSTGKFARVSGIPGAYIAEVEINHFSGPVLARNCHSGTVKRLMNIFKKRGCLEQYAIISVNDNYKGIPFSYPASCQSCGPPEIQAFWDTFFEDIGGWDEGVAVPPAKLNEIFQYVREGRIVGLAFTGGNWGQRSGSYNFYNTDPTVYRHTAVLEIDQNGQIQIVNTSPTSNTSKSLLDVEKGEYKIKGEVTYPFPAERLNEFRNLRTAEALELYLCGAKSCLEDGSRNQWQINPYKDMPYEGRATPWTAVRIYVERAQKIEANVQLSTGQGWSFPACCPMVGFGFIDIVGGGWPSLLSQGQDGENMLFIMLGKTLFAPGTFDKMGNLIDGNDMDIDFTNVGITHYYGLPVSFTAKSGVLNLENYGINLKDRVKGTFSVEIEGKQEFCLDPTWESSKPCSSEMEFPITGTINGNFDGYLLFMEKSGV